MEKRPVPNKILLLVLLLFLGACRKEDPESIPSGQNYFPVDVGRYSIYSVTEIEIDAAVSRYDTSRYFLKEKLHSVFTDNAGEPCIRVERFWRNADTLPWVIKDVWYFYRNERNAQKVEENIRYIRMAFPVYETTVWNGNAMNTLDSRIYSYGSVGIPYSVGSLNFSTTVQIDHQSSFNNLVNKNGFEIYAEGIGMISKRDVDCEILGGDSTNVQRGIMLFQSIIEYGVE